jgi:DNA-directed RNA polymerase subunit K/omega
MSDTEVSNIDDEEIVVAGPVAIGGDDSSDDYEEDNRDEDEDEDEEDNGDINADADAVVKDTTVSDIDSYFEDSFGNILTNKPLSKRIRMIKIVAPNNRITSNFITKLEMARAKGIRAEQIDTNGHTYTDIDNCGDAISIAEKEFFDRRSPLVLCRMVGKNKNKVIEKWSVREMTYPVGLDTKL